jgi:hypothetical protein
VTGSPVVHLSNQNNNPKTTAGINATNNLK